MLRQLSKNPQEENVTQIEELQQSILAQFLALEGQQASSGISSGQTTLMDEDDITCFDDLDDTESDAHTAQTGGEEPTLAPANTDRHQIRIPMMPSTSEQPAPREKVAELMLRKRQASKLLKSLRDAIADKSFQYSHVIRVAPRKRVSNRARKTIIILNNSISFYCRAYNKCRSAMIRLDAEERTLARFRVLTRDDVKSSTALLNPNIPGSTQHRLSWIWQIGLDGQNQNPQALQECTFIPIVVFSF
jgi:hypothetical protein